MYEVILFPTDGSTDATVALDHAIDQAAVHGATLDVLYAADDEADAEETGHDAVESAAQRVSDADVDVNTAVIEGDPDDVILDYLTDRGVDLVVMGSHGRRGLDRLLAGSVAETVLRSADVPVLVVPCGE